MLHSANSMSSNQFFSISYQESLERFEAAAQPNSKIIKLEHTSLLYPITIAWFGETNPKNLVLHIAGTHGIEGYLGAAIQLAILKQGFKVRNDTAVIFV